MLPLSQRNTTQQRHSLSSNFYFRFSFVIALLFVFSACTKSVQEKAVEPIQAEEIVNWFKEYKQKMPGAPNPVYSAATKTFINDLMIVRIPLLSGEGEMFFAKKINGKDLEVLFFRRVGTYDNVSKNFTGYYESINMTNYVYHKIVYVNGIKVGEFKSQSTKIKKIENSDVKTLSDYEGTWFGAFLYCLSHHLFTVPKKTIGAGWDCGGIRIDLGSQNQDIQPGGGGGGGADIGDILPIIFRPHPNPDGLLPSHPNWTSYSSFGPGGGFAKPPSIDDLYPELNGQISDENVRIEYKRNYAALVELYNLRNDNGLMVDLYAGMSSKEFIDLLKNNQLLALNIDPITILVKAGASGAADILVQMFFARLLDDNVSDWNEALTKVNWWQVGLTMATGALPISNKYILAAANAGSAVFAELGKNGFTSWEKLGSSFVEGFMGSIIGSSLGDLIADKFANIGNLGRRLITKFEGIFSYETICRWLGGGLKIINKSITHNGQAITASRMMKGFADNKVAVIGRNMKERVMPFANSLSNDLGVPVLTWPGFNAALSDAQNLANNQAWIKSLKVQGYTFYDVGLDPYFTSRGNFDEGLFYSMELNEIFR